MALLLAAAIASLLAFRLGISWKRILKKMVNTIHSAMPAILILLIIGALAGAWMISGVVPAMIYYGLDIISPRFFLVTAVVVGSIVSVATGSSWSTVATIGVALLGIGKAIGISDAVVAGAIISGLISGIRCPPERHHQPGTGHGRHRCFYPCEIHGIYNHSLSVAYPGDFLVFGFSYDFSEITVDVTNTRTVIGETFNINLWLFLVPLFLLAIIILKVPPLPALLAGALAGALFAIIFQPHIIAEVAGGSGNPFRDGYHAAMQAMFGQVNLTTRDAGVNELLSTTGMRGCWIPSG